MAVLVSGLAPYWSDEQATLYQGDALRVLEGLASHTVNAVITDPPYASGGLTTTARKAGTGQKYQSSDAVHKLPDFTGDQRDQRSWSMWCTLWLSECLRITKPGGSLLMFCDWRQYPSATDAMQMAGWVWRGVAPWVKPKGTARPVRGGLWNQSEFILWGVNGSLQQEYEVYVSGAFEEGAPRGDQRQHQTQKPLGVLRELVKIAPPGSVVVDPFMGSGTTGDAARLEGRRFIGVELHAHYLDVASTRLQSTLSLAITP